MIDEALEDLLGEAAALENGGHSADALRLLTAKTSLYSQQPEFQFALSALAFRSGDLDSAESAARAACTLAELPEYRGNLVAVLLAKADTFLSAGQHEEAEKAFLQVLSLESSEIHAWYHLAALQHLRGDTKAAVKSIDSLLESAAGFEPAVAARAFFLRELGQGTE